MKLDRQLKPGKTSSKWSLDYVLYQTFALIDDFGYVGKCNSLDNDCPTTASRLWHLLNQSTDYKTGLPIYDPYTISDKYQTEIQKFIDFYTAVPDDSKFFVAMKQLIAANTLRLNECPLVAAAVGYMLKQQDNKNSTPSAYIAAIGARVELSGSVTKLYQRSGKFGVNYIYLIKSGANEVIWKTLSYVRPNSTIKITGTVRDHIMYKDRKQTEISNCTFTYIF